MWRIIVMGGWTVIGIMLGAATGCDGRPASITDSAVSWTNEHGRAFGKVAGVNIEVLGLEEKQAVVNTHVRVTQGLVKTSEVETWELTAGEVELELFRETGAPLKLKVEGRNYGVVNPGDDVLVGKNRSVEVNGNRRSPE